MLRRAVWAVGVMVVSSGCLTDGGGGGMPDAVTPDPVDASVDSDPFPDDQPLVGCTADGIMTDVGQTLWFRLTSAGSEWQVFEVTIPNPGPYSKMETALYDARGVEVAKGYALFESWGHPGVIRAYLTTPGDYYVRLTDDSDKDLGPPDFSAYAFTLICRPPAAPSEWEDPETGDTPGDNVLIDREPMGLGLFAFVLGLHEHPADVDHFAIDVNADERVLMSVVEGSARRLDLVEPGGAVYARVDLEAYPTGRIDSPMILSPGRWTVATSGPETTAGRSYLAYVSSAGDFFLDSQPEAEDPASPGTNDDLAGAESLTLFASSDDMGTPGLIGIPSGRLTGDGDLDLYTFTIDATSDVLLSCAGGFYGSGARPLAIELLDGGGTVLAGADEAHGSALINRAPHDPGVYVLRVSKLAQDPEVLGDFYRCIVDIVPVP